jgi:hypothetical protein
MVLIQPAAHFIKSHKRSRGDHTGLPHSTAQKLPDPTRFRYRLRASAEDRTDRRREAFREAKLHRIDRGTEIARLNAERHCGVEDARAVEVYA